jgi:hypothetical protein
VTPGQHARDPHLKKLGDACPLSPPSCPPFAPLVLLSTAAFRLRFFPLAEVVEGSELSGNVLNGSWSDNTGTGTLTFTLSPDGNSFTGTWKRLTGGGTASGTWNGTRLR